MTKILVVERLNIFNIFIVTIYKIFKFEIYIYKFSKKIAKWRYLKFLSLRECNFEECSDIEFKYCVGKDGDAIDIVTNEWIDSELLNKFIPFFTDVKNSREKNKLLLKEYVLRRCSTLNEIHIWVDGYFANHKENDIKIYLMGNICKISARFLEIRSNHIKVTPVFSSNSFILINLAVKFCSVIFRKIFSILNVAIANKKVEVFSKKNQVSFINNDINTLAYDILYFPHQSIFFGDLFIKDNFYSKDINSVFYPSNILHIELEDISISEDQYKYYLDNNISTIIFPKPKIKKLYDLLIYVLSEIGLKNVLFLLRKNYVQFFVFLWQTLKFLSTKNLVKERYSPKLILIGYEILFPVIFSLAFESLKIRTIASQERFLPTFFPHIFFCVDTYLSNSELVCKTIQDTSNKFVNNCIPCGQIRSDLLIEYQKNNTIKNERFNIVAFDFHSDLDFNNNRLEAIINWKANASFYKDLCNLAEGFPKIDIIIRGKNTDWTKIPFFKNTLNTINRISNIWIDGDYTKLNRQYELASKSDLVIAKPTSIGDELIASGKRVIYYDYFPNSSHYFASEYCNYNNCNVFAFSYAQLNKMVQIVVNGEELLTDNEVLELQIMTNNSPADGRVRENVMKNLDIIYAQACL